MLIGNFIPQNIQRTNNRPQIRFGNRYDKLIDTIMTARPKQISLNEAEINSILEREGFDISINNCRIIGKKPGEQTFMTTKPAGKSSKSDPQVAVWFKEYFARKNAAGREAKLN